jgi:hypothetical protein
MAVVLPDPTVQRYFPGERHFEELAAAEPAFAGFFVEAGRLVVNVSDPVRDGAIRSLVAARMPIIRRGRPAIPVETRTVAFSFLELAAWRNLVFREIAPAVEIVSLDLDEVENRVAIGVASENAMEEARRAALARGIPPEAVYVALDRLALPGLRAASSPKPSEAALRWRNHTDLTDRRRPIMGGQRIESGNGVDTFPVCTVGFSAVTAPGGDTIVVTASHCTEDVFGMDGGSTGLYQREGDDADDLIGWEAVDPDGFIAAIMTFVD